MTSKPLCSSSRLDYFPPLEKFDDDCYELYSDEKVMLPFIPQLYKMDPFAFKERRNGHRLKCLNQNCFLDIVHRESGDFLGTCGFREFRSIPIENLTVEEDHIFHCENAASKGSPRIGEFGVNICHRYQRQGFCTEAFFQMLRFSLEKLNCTEIEGVTMTGNTPMRNFFEKFGLYVAEKVYINESGQRNKKQLNMNDVEHIVYQGNIRSLLSKCGH